MIYCVLKPKQKIMRARHAYGVIWCNNIKIASTQIPINANYDLQTFHARFH